MNKGFLDTENNIPPRHTATDGFVPYDKHQSVVPNCLKVATCI